MTRAAINGFGAVLTTVTTIIELGTKFTEGAWLILLVIPGLVLMFNRVHRTYDRIGALLGIGKTPEPPSKQKSLVVVPVSGLSRLTAEGISAALSLGDEVIAVTVCFADPEDEERWRDSQRDNKAGARGIQTTRYGWRDVYGHACETAALQAQILRRRGWSGTPRRCSADCPVGRERLRTGATRRPA